MKKLLLIISTMYLTGCSVAKPVVLSAPLQLINRAYTNTTTRNGANDIEIVAHLNDSTRDPIDNNFRIEFYYELYITPLNNQLNFTYRDDDRSTGTSGSYRSFDASLFFQTKVSARIYYFNTVTGELVESFTTTQTMITSTHVEDHRFFKMYKLPYDTTLWKSGGNNIYSYIYNNQLSATYNENTDTITITPVLYSFDAYRNVILNGQIYWRYLETTNIADLIPNDPELGPNKLSLFYYYDLNTLGGFNISRWKELENYNNLSRFENQARERARKCFDLINENEAVLNYRYNAAMSEELTAFNDGFNEGVEEGTEGVGVGWIRQVFRAIQAFLDFDFGFFKLGHLLGGILVIAIVIFVVRWFR